MPAPVIEGFTADPHATAPVTALAVAAVILVGGRYLPKLPFALVTIAALAGVLLATTVRMVEAASLAAIARAPRGDAVVMAITFVVTVASDLVTAVVIGIGFALVLAVRAVAKEARLHQVPLDESDHLGEDSVFPDTGAAITYARQLIPASRKHH